MKPMHAGRLVLLAVVSLVQASCGDESEPAVAPVSGRSAAVRAEGGIGATSRPIPAARASQPAPAVTQPADASQPLRPGTRGSIGADGLNVMFCTDARRLDTAMDFAKYGNSRMALMTMSDPVFFDVAGPVAVEVLESDTKSRWPKVLLKVLDGNSAGKTGWVVLSAVRDFRQSSE